MTGTGTSDRITICCPCGFEARAPRRLAGKKVRCKGCDAGLRVPPEDDAREVDVARTAPAQDPGSSPALRLVAGAVAVIVLVLLVRLVLLATGIVVDLDPPPAAGMGFPIFVKIPAWLAIIWLSGSYAIKGRLQAFTPTAP